jgi:hypothetical protein
MLIVKIQAPEFRGLVIINEIDSGFFIVEKAGEITVEVFQEVPHIQHIITIYGINVLEPGYLRSGQVIDIFKVFFSLDDGSHEGLYLATGTVDIEKPHVIFMFNNFYMVFLVVLPTGTAFYCSNQPLDQTFVHKHRFPVPAR